ncbi:arginine methyl transferase [Pyrrhoderma noxium]|uniref:Arginine methyl transferase n=1 Tax=Pyrrhoderma noxium TaxID=2282107 RepID=A0A286UG84_9AGAM|nr:arginine methyl transferase [Pyrrhoderma noxium]
MEVIEEPQDITEINEHVQLGQTLIDQIFDREPLETLKETISQGAPLWYQDEDGNSALHAAAYNEDKELVDLLLEKGAVWNAVDNLGNTAGDVALSLNNEGCYRAIRDTGLRSEYLLSHLSSKKTSIASSSNILLKSVDTTAAGSTDTFLHSQLRFITDANGQEICLVKAGDDEIGVMMGWEREIMRETVDQLCSGISDDYSVLNIGFGLGIIDSMFQRRKNPPNSIILSKLIQTYLRICANLGESEELLSVGGFDVIYTDTFSEDYQALREFFEHLPDLLSGPEARFSFFNGLGATNALFYDVYTQLSELHLSNVGLSVQWSEVDVIGKDSNIDKWNGTRNYFGMRLYRLPVASMSPIE